MRKYRSQQSRIVPAFAQEAVAQNSWKLSIPTVYSTSKQGYLGRANKADVDFWGPSRDPLDEFPTVFDNHSMVSDTVDSKERPTVLTVSSRHGPCPGRLRGVEDYISIFLT